MAKAVEKKKPSLLNRIITWILVVIIIGATAMLVPELYALYREWQLKHNYNGMVVHDAGDGEVIIDPDWAQLKAQNEDIVGWIAVPNTPINYPILQGPDNEFYLHRASNKEKNKFGSIFLDSKANPDFSDDNTLVYGHNVSGNNSMFSKLTNFLNPEFFQANPNFYILTPNGKFQCQILTVNRLLDSSKSYDTQFSNPQQVVDLVEQNRAQAQLKSEVPFELGDKLVTLSTCDLNFGLESEHRIILTAKLVPYEGEVKMKIT